MILLGILRINFFHGSLYLSRVDRLHFYATTFRDIDEIETLINIITGSDEAVEALNKELFPDRIKINGSIRTLHTELKLSAQADKNEGTRIEVNERLIAAYRLKEILEINERLCLGSNQINYLSHYKDLLDTNENPIANIRNDEKHMFKGLLETIIDISSGRSKVLRN